MEVISRTLAQNSGKLHFTHQYLDVTCQYLDVTCQYLVITCQYLVFRFSIKWLMLAGATVGGLYLSNDATIAFGNVAAVGGALFIVLQVDDFSLLFFSLGL